MSLRLKPIKRMQHYLDLVNAVLLERAMQLRTQLGEIHERNDQLFHEQDATDIGLIELMLGPNPTETIRAFHQQQKAQIRQLAAGYWGYQLRLQYIKLQYFVQGTFYKAKLALLKTEQALLHLPQRLYTTIKRKKYQDKAVNRHKK